MKNQSFSLFNLSKNSFFNIYQKLTKKKVVRILAIIAAGIYWFSFVLSLFLIGLYGINPFSPLVNLISDLGSNAYSPIPYLFDIACIWAGFLSIPISLYIFRYLRKKTNPEIDNGRKSQKRFKLINLFILISGILGDIGFIGIGIFSIDRNPYNIHFLFASFLFVGYYISAFLIGILYLLFDIKINRFIALYGFLASIITFIIVLILGLFQIYLVIFEWIADFILISWLYSFLFSILRKSA